MRKGCAVKVRYQFCGAYAHERCKIAICALICIKKKRRALVMRRFGGHSRNEPNAKQKRRPEAPLKS